MDGLGRAVAPGLATADVGNNLLRALRPADLAALRPALEPWQGEVGALVYRPGDMVDHVYFPCGPALISFRVILEDGREVETALVGREGAVGGIVSQGNLPAFARAEIQVPGEFLRLRLTALEAAKRRSPALEGLFARYADCLMAQMFQAIACNAVHSIEQRTAKWLLAAMERTGADSVALTQEQVAGMLGVGRSYISRVIQSLKARGLVETRRGGLRVTDPQGLSGLSCECNRALRRHFDEVLRGVYPTAAENRRLARLGPNVVSPARWAAVAGKASRRR
jgi:CRP-like cAMP-binding protein